MTGRETFSRRNDLTWKELHMRYYPKSLLMIPALLAIVSPFRAQDLVNAQDRQFVEHAAQGGMKEVRIGQM
jgi:hypothetical protein